MLRLESITKDFKTGNNVVNVLKGITIQFRKSEFVSVLGHSGCGKTTLLNLIGGLDRCTSGGVIIDGRNTADYNDLDWNDYRNKRIGFVFQSYNLIPHLTILKNVELAMTLAGVSKEERRERAMKALERVGLAEHAKKHPSQMSGGQMQRVAIARALVNNPEIILADEPTGALDSESGIEVMNILKEVSSDRLVIMVTHNEQLAKEYSTRIVTMSDGFITGDTDEYSLEDCLKDEKAALEEKKKAEDIVRENIEKQGKNAKRTIKKLERRKRRKTSMSPLTAFSLSFTNLVSKKGRTFLTSFAGSIGIIGIMLVLSLSTGASKFISRMEENALSYYPIEINETSSNLSSILSLLTDDSSVSREKYPDSDVIYTNKVISGLFSPDSPLTQKNDLGNLKTYIDGNLDSLAGYVKYDYGTSFDVYCDYKVPDDEKGKKYMKVQPFMDAVDDIEMFKKYMELLKPMADELTVWDEMSDNKELLEQQYELIGDNSRWPSSYDEVVLVIDRYNQLNDFLLFALGLKSKDDIGEAILGGSEFSASTFAVDDILENLEYRIATGCDYYSQNSEGKWTKLTEREDQRDVSFVEGQGTDVNGNVRDNTLKVKVVGVIRPRETAQVTSIRGNIGYTSALTEYLAERAESHPLVKYVSEECCDANGNPVTTKEQTDLLRSLGVPDLDVPKKISIYADSFDSKEKIISFINTYNESQPDNKKIKYTDNLSLIMDYVETMTATITGVLIGFAAISLIVSSIMIAIIIYTSVIERKKEIGVLRSIGARKSDVSGVFIAESGIIGCLSGVIGIALAYLLMLPINVIIFNLFRVPNLASVVWWQPLMMFGISIVLSVLAGFIPARIAANKDPVECLRSE